MGKPNQFKTRQNSITYEIPAIFQIAIASKSTLSLPRMQEIHKLLKMKAHLRARNVASNFFYHIKSLTEILLDHCHACKQSTKHWKREPYLRRPSISLQYQVLDGHLIQQVHCHACISIYTYIYLAISNN